MKEKILNTATEMFLNLGFKSVTMDEIAEKLGISKKTIYAHYPNKAKLVQACAAELFNEISEGIDEIIEENHNPIDEHLRIHQFILNKLKKEKASPQYQLKKYYPKIEQSLRKKKINQMRECVICNLEKGKEMGFYRNDINIDVVFQFYRMLLEGIKDSDFFVAKKYSNEFVLKHFLEYHFRAIASEKGLAYINQLTVKNLYS